MPVERLPALTYNAALRLSVQSAHFAATNSLKLCCGRMQIATAVDMSCLELSSYVHFSSW